MACLTFHSGWWRDWRGYVWRRLTDAVGVEFALGAYDVARGSYPSNFSIVRGVHARQKQVGGEWVDDQDYIVFCGRLGQLLIRRDGVWEKHDLYNAFGGPSVYVPHFSGVYVLGTDDLILVGNGTGTSPPGGAYYKGCVWRWKNGTLSLLVEGLGNYADYARMGPAIHGYAGGYSDSKQLIVATFGTVAYRFSRFSFTSPFGPAEADVDDWGDWVLLPGVGWSWIADVRVAKGGFDPGTADVYDHPVYGIWLGGGALAHYRPATTNWATFSSPTGGAMVRLTTTPDPWVVWCKEWAGSGSTYCVRRVEFDDVGGATWSNKKSIHWGDDGDMSVARNRAWNDADPPRYVTCAVHRTGISGCSTCGRLFESRAFGESDTYAEIIYWAESYGPSMNEYPGGVIQFEIPLVSNQSPTPDSTGVVSRPTIQADVTDEDGILVDSDSVVLRVDRGLGDGWEVAFENGAAAENWVGSLTAISGGYRVSATPDESLPSNSTIKAFAYAENFLGNHTLEDETTWFPGMSPPVYEYVPGSGHWEFETADFPYLRNQDPPDGGTGNVDAVPYFEVVDDADGIAEGTIVVDVWRGSSWEPVWTGSSEQPGYDVVETPVSDGFGFAVDPDVEWLDGTTVRFRVYAEDVLGNSSTLYYEFTIPPLIPPVLRPVSPTRGAVDVGVGLDLIEFDLTDDGTFVEPWYVGVHRGAGWEPALAVDGGGVASFYPGFAGSRSELIVIDDGYRVRIHLEEPISVHGRRVFVGVSVKDDQGLDPVVED